MRRFDVTRRSEPTSFCPAWRRRAAARRGLASDVRSVVAVEFAILAIPLFMFMLFIFEISYDLFTQEALDAGLHAAVRQIQTGNAQNVRDGSQFIQNYLCPDLRGLLECGNHVFIRVDKLTFAAGEDYYKYTNGVIPVNGNTLDTTGYLSANFCNSGATQPLLVSAIYIGPTFIGGLLPYLLSVNYGGSLVHATLSTAAIVSEAYPTIQPGAGTTPAPPC